MDLLDFEADELYFDEPAPEPVEELLLRASMFYGDPSAETYLLQAYLRAPKNLTVLVALYRFYFFQHRHEEALLLADKAMSASGHLLAFPEQWQSLNRNHVGYGARQSIGLVRFYLLALKAAGFLNLRLGHLGRAKEMLVKVSELDNADRLGARALLEVVGMPYNMEPEGSGQFSAEESA